MSEILYARTNAGELLPIIDVTNPAFAVSLSDDELAAMAAQYVAEAAQREVVSPQLRAALGQSRLGRGLMEAQGGFLDGLTTYLLKVGPDNLPSTVHPIDRRIAASFPAVTSRVRVQDMADLLADGLRGRLAAAPKRPLHMINIAGGPAADSWNALITLVASGTPLRNREVSITVLDIDAEGPSFGRHAVQTLTSESGPLHGLQIQFEYVEHNWGDADHLRRVVTETSGPDRLCALSSEGGLFEYGSDAEISGSLAVLAEATPADTIIAGTVTREGEFTRAHSSTHIAIRPRRREEFARLAQDSGWRIDALIERPFSDHLRMVKGK